MSGNCDKTCYEELCTTALVKEENISDTEGDKSECGDVSANQNQGEDGDQLQGLYNDAVTVCSVKMEEEQEDCEVKPFEAVFFKEEDNVFSDSWDSDPLAIKEENGIENAVGFEKEEVLADNEDPVSSNVNDGDAYPSCSKNGSNSKPQQEYIVCGSSKQNKHCNLSSVVTAVPENDVNVNSQCRSIDKINMKESTTCDKPFQCSFCQYRCSTKINLKRHMSTHIAVKPFQCCYCDYSSSRKEHLKTHMLKHSGVKPFQCSYCVYRCSTKSNLKTHVLTHTIDEPFQCPDCDYCCLRKANFKIHLLTHSAHKLFQCPYCEYCCLRKANLNTHILTHTADKNT